MVGDYQVAVDEATAFLSIAKLCTDDVGKFLLGKMYPFAVNASLSCELFIKAIMIKKSPTDEFVKGHDLKELYNALESNDKAEIELLYKNKCVKPLSELLDESGNAFIEWRYALENGVSICVNGIIAFAEALQEYSKTIA